MSRVLVLMGIEHSEGNSSEIYQLLTNLRYVGTYYDDFEGSREELLDRITDDFSEIILRECPTPVKVHVSNGHKKNSGPKQLIQIGRLDEHLANAFYQTLDSKLSQKAVKLDGRLN